MSDTSISNTGALGGAGENEPSDNRKNNNENENSRTRKRPAPPEPEECIICRGEITDRSTPSVCDHQFCFGCLSRWASSSWPKCPMCQAFFIQIRHNFRDNNEYDTVFVRLRSPSPIELPSWMNIDNHGSSRQSARRNQPLGNEHQPTTSPNAPMRRIDYEYPTPPPPPVDRVYRAEALHGPLLSPFGLTNLTGSFPWEHQHPHFVITAYPSHIVSASTAPEFALYENRRAQQRSARTRGDENTSQLYEQNQRPEHVGLTPRNVLYEHEWAREYFLRHPDMDRRVRTWIEDQIRIFHCDWNSTQIFGGGISVMASLRVFGDSEGFRNDIREFFGDYTELFQHKLYHFMVAIEPYENNLWEQARTSRFGQGAAGGQNAQPEIVNLLDSEEENDTMLASRHVSVRQNGDNIGPASSNGLPAAADSYPGNSLANAVAARQTGNHAFGPAQGSSLSTPGTSNGINHVHELHWSRQPHYYPVIPTTNQSISPAGSLNIVFNNSNSTATVNIVEHTGVTVSTVTTPPNSEIWHGNFIVPSGSGIYNATIWNYQPIRVVAPEFDMTFDFSRNTFSPSAQMNGPVRIPNFNYTQPQRVIGNMHQSIGERNNAASIAGFGGFPFGGVGNQNMRSNPGRQGNFSSMFPPFPSQFQEPSEQPRPSCMYATSTSSSSSSSSSSSAFLRSFASVTGASPTMSSVSSVSGISSAEAMASSSSSAGSSSTFGASTFQASGHTLVNTDDNDSDSDSDSSDIVCLGSFPARNQAQNTHETENLPNSDNMSGLSDSAINVDSTSDTELQDSDILRALSDSAVNEDSSSDIELQDSDIFRALSDSAVNDDNSSDTVLQDLYENSSMSSLDSRHLSPLNEFNSAPMFDSYTIGDLDFE